MSVDTAYRAQWLLCLAQAPAIRTADYAGELTEGTTQVPEHLAYYIDYEKMGCDMELGGDVFCIETGYQEVHIFWSH